MERLMKTTIYYFSGTGNSLYIAKKIADAAAPCKLIPIPKALKEADLLKTHDERIGIVLPLYYGGLPNIAAKFLQNAEFSSAKYIFLIVTAGHTIGSAISEANSCLKSKGKELSYGKYLAMPDNYIPMFNIHPDKAKRILEKTEKNIALIIEDILKLTKKPGDTMLIGPIIKAWHRRWLAGCHNEDTKFTVDDSCTSCRICEKVCPAENITFDGNFPKWNHHCEQCLACIQFCPQKAIQFGNKTKNKYRYHHPSITWEEISRQK